jgi:hypothetical protein
VPEALVPEALVPEEAQEAYVFIASDRLKELEALELSIPSIIENAIKEYKNNNLQRLHERDKLNPGAINLRVKRYTDKHREEINNKRRENRRLQKLAACQINVKPITSLPQNTITLMYEPPTVKVRKTPRVKEAVIKTILASSIPIVRAQAGDTKGDNVITVRNDEGVTPHHCLASNDAVTVRFDI